MRNRISHLFVSTCLITVSLVAQPSNPQKGSISGSITVNKQPLPGITVTLEPPPGESSSELRKPFSTKTDSGGRYTFGGVPKGQYVITPRAGAYAESTVGMTASPLKTVTLGEGEQITGVDFSLTKGGVITGKVVDYTGRPLIQERIRLSRKRQNNRSDLFMPSRMYLTDDRGIYRLYGLPAGQYLVSVGDSGNDGSVMVGRAGGYLRITYYPGTTNDTEAKFVEVTEGGEVTEIDIKVGKLERIYDARGRIVDAAKGSPLVGVRFSYGPLIPGRDQKIGSYGNSSERTNAQGEFLIQGLVPGKYGVFLEPEQGTDYYSDPAVFDVLASDAEGVEVKAYRGSSISGFLVVEGTNDPSVSRRMTDVRVSAIPMTTGLASPASGRYNTNPDGTFSLSGLRPGKVMVGVFARPPLQFIRLEREGVTVAKEMELAAGERVTGVKVLLGYGTGTIRGQLTMVGGTLPPDTRFIVLGRKLDSSNTPLLGPNGNVLVDSVGKFLIEGLLPGEYEVQVYPIGGMGVRPPSGLKIDKQIVNVGVGESAVRVTVDLSQRKDERQ